MIAELPGKTSDNVVMAGAHLDSVGKGPGINDNGSGSAALLETALMMANSKPQNTLRFGWWAAEEHGLLGSADYVAGLSAAELDRIALYMNYDMVASPNSIFMVYDADESTFPAPVAIPPGSTAIEDVYEAYYTMIGLPYEDSEGTKRPPLSPDMPCRGGAGPPDPAPPARRAGLPPSVPGWRRRPPRGSARSVDHRAGGRRRRRQGPQRWPRP